MDATGGVRCRPQSAESFSALWSRCDSVATKRPHNIRKYCIRVSHLKARLRPTRSSYIMCPLVGDP